MPCAEILLLLVSSIIILSCSGQSPGDLRLWQNGQSSRNYSNGRLQVYIGGKWGEVCDDGFGDREAEVACHQLQFRRSSGSSNEEAESGQLEDDDENGSDLLAIGLSDVHCPSSDYLHLLRCSFQLGQHSCTGRGYTMLHCDSTHIWSDPYFGQIRLIQGEYSSQGVAQVYCESGWGGICSGGYLFGKREADIVCRQLGYTESTHHNHLDLLQTSGSVLMEVGGCPNEMMEIMQCLGQCQQCSQKEIHYCPRQLTLECKFDPLQYAFGSNVSNCEGYSKGGWSGGKRPRVGEVRTTPTGYTDIAELFHDLSGTRMWNGICSSKNEDNDQNVAHTFCVQLGYSEAANYTSLSVNDSSDVMSDSFLSVSCASGHSHLLWCDIVPADISNCSSVLAVTCKSYNSSSHHTGEVRLVGGDFSSEGRVEMFVHGVWSSVETDRVSYYAYNGVAQSICRQLGYTDSVHYYQETVPTGNGPSLIVAPLYSRVQPCLSRCLSGGDYRKVGVDSYTQMDKSGTTDTLLLSVNCSFSAKMASAITVGSKEMCRVDAPPLVTTTPVTTPIPIIDPDIEPDNHSEDNHSHGHNEMISVGEILGIVIGIAIFVFIVGTVVTITCYVTKKQEVKGHQPKRFSVANSGWGYQPLPTHDREARHSVPPTPRGQLHSGRGCHPLPTHNKDPKCSIPPAQVGQVHSGWEYRPLSTLDEDEDRHSALTNPRGNKNQNGWRETSPAFTSFKRPKHKKGGFLTPTHF